jgi:hypothetical protein
MASVRLRLPFAIALVLLNGADGPDSKKIALPKIRRSWAQLVLDRPLFALGITLRPLCDHVVKPHDPV